ncbi:MAG: hypothetical protein ACE15C_14225 [Phycisphaerae bacterium]
MVLSSAAVSHPGGRAGRGLAHHADGLTRGARAWLDRQQGSAGAWGGIIDALAGTTATIASALSQIGFPKWRGPPAGASRGHPALAR